MAEYFVINGGKKLEGEITVGIAKNAALKILAASILTSKPIKLPKMPNIEDVDRMKELLIDLGAEFSGNFINSSGIKKTDLNYKMAGGFRA